jgi:hypothetical protein
VNYDCVVDPQMQLSGQFCRGSHRTRNELRLHNVDPRTCSLIGVNVCAESGGSVHVSYLATAFFMSKLLSRVRRKMLCVGLPLALDYIAARA